MLQIHPVSSEDTGVFTCEGTLFFLHLKILYLFFLFASINRSFERDRHTGDAKCVFERTICSQSILYAYRTISTIGYEWNN